MAVSNVFEKIGRAVFESPFAAKRLTADSPELAEIRLVLLDEARAKSHKVSGRYVFPYNAVRLLLRGIPAQQADVFSSDFMRTYLTGELKNALARSGHRFPEDLTVEIETTPDLPATGQQWLSVSAEASGVRPEPAAGVPNVLTVMAGTANHARLELDRARINIGRIPETFRAGGPSRQNQLVFSEDTEINRTVSREHAHILVSKKTGICRLFNDRWYKGEENCGLWIVRDGLSQPVHRSSRGTELVPGDDIHLGRAILRFEFGS
ncbi:MAG: hypothetical protein JO217_05095 [Acidobacteriaceae bacterium]|nr:hypothetical protein [Acidobacteriaceae bacterium]MBV9442051.1 hypothetical protein [Acidobacteriaceae bacterium]